MIESILQDLRHGARMLVKNPGFTLVAVASIGIGVGVNAAMFSLADGLVLRPLQVPRAGEIVAVSAIAPRATESFITNRQLSYPDYADLRDQARSFDGLLAYGITVASFATSGTSRPRASSGSSSAATSSTCSICSRLSAASSGPTRIRCPAATRSSCWRTRPG